MDTQQFTVGPHTITFSEARSPEYGEHLVCTIEFAAEENHHQAQPQAPAPIEEIVHEA